MKKKNKEKLSLYRSKTIARERKDLKGKRKLSDSNIVIPCKLSRPDSDKNVSVSDDVSTVVIVEDGVRIEGGNLCNSVPPSVSADNDVDDADESLKNKAKKLLTDDSLISALIDILFENGLLIHYMAHFKELSSGNLNPKNVAVLFGLERAYWQTLETTTNMTYDVITKKWYAVCAKLFGNSLLSMCSGEKNYGQVISQTTTKGKYCPSKSKINFAVPHRRHLCAVSKSFPKIIHPGIIQEGVNLVRNQTDLILMVDCKKVARGLEDDFLGDVNLMGYEEPKVEMLKRTIERDCTFIEKSLHDLDSMDIQIKYHRIYKCFSILCKRIKHLREKQQKQKFQLAKYEQRVLASSSTKEKQELQYPISRLKTFLYLSYLWIKKCLSTTTDLCRLASNILATKHLLQLDGICTFDKQCNTNLLHCPEVMSKYVDFENSSQIVQQGTEQWNVNRRKSLVTASTLYSALGLRGMKEAKWHFRQFVLADYSCVYDELTLKLFKHGSDNEVHNKLCVYIKNS